MVLKCQQMSQEYLNQTKSCIPSVEGQILLAQTDQDYKRYSSFRVENEQLTIEASITGPQYYYSAQAYVKKIQIAKNQNLLMNKLKYQKYWNFSSCDSCHYFTLYDSVIQKSCPNSSNICKKSGKKSKNLQNAS